MIKAERNGDGGKLHIVGIAGSLRKESLNRKLLRAAIDLAPEGFSIEPFALDEIPLYNADLDNEDDRPEAVTRLKEAIRKADGVLIASPEYNHGVPGVLQNAIDWASRPGGKSPLAGKPVAIMGASPGAVGTARGQQQLKLVLMSTLAHVLPHPGIVVNHAGSKFDEEGHLQDEASRKFLGSFLLEMEAWILRLGDPIEIAS